MKLRSGKMGLRDRLKKGSEENKPESIGGIVDENEVIPDEASISEEDTGFSQHDSELPSPPPPPEPPAPASEEKKPEEAGSGLGSLDIFTQEASGDDEGNKLAEQLPEVDLQDLLRECQEIASRLAEHSDQTIE